MKELIIVGAEIGMASNIAHLAHIHSLADSIIILDELKHLEKEPGIFPITLIDRTYTEFDHLTRKKKPVNKEWQKRIKNLQNSIK